MSPTLALDHIIVLLPAKALDNLPKPFTEAFTITPGGTHADGKTYNKLVVLESGVYLEFIAFVNDDPSRKEGHWWGRKPPGTIVDWALTSKDVKDIERLADVGLYDSPRAGGRKRPDGKNVEWFVTFPRAGTERGSVPFFCHDVTPRELRVPAELTGHPSNVTGVRHLVVVAAKEKISGIAEAYTAILGQPLEQDGKAWRLKEPKDLTDAENITSEGPVIELREASSEEELQLVKENGGIAGIKEITLFTTHRHDEGFVEVELEGHKIRINTSLP
jgi:hypothetical protein